MNRIERIAVLALGLALLAPSGQAQEPLEPRVMFVALRVADLERSLAFYTEVIGMREFARYPGEGSELDVALTFAKGAGGAEPTDSGAMLLLIPRKPEAGPVEHGDGLSRVALGVPDVAGVVAKARAGGHEVTRDPYTISDGRTVGFVRDPDGYRIELIGAASPGS